jgi:hypothetical protein
MPGKIEAIKIIGEIATPAVNCLIIINSIGKQIKIRLIAKAKDDCSECLVLFSMFKKYF